MKIKLLALFFFFFSSEAFSQSEQLDSLLNSLKLEKEEDKKMKIISNVLKKAYYSKPEIFNFYLDSLHFYSKSLDEKKIHC